MDQLAIEGIHSDRPRVAQPHHAVRDRLEDRLHVRWRTANDPQDLACGRLLLQRLGHPRMRLGEGFVLLLQLSEQPHVLDRDDGLVGERFEQRRLLV